MATPLTGLGLTLDEARAYLFLLRHGPAAASVVAKGIRVSRPRGYRVLEALTAAGLALPHLGRPRTYAGVPPTVMFKTLELRANALAEKVAQARRDLLPAIEGLQQHAAAPPESPTFAILHSHDVLVTQAHQLVSKARGSLDIVVTAEGGLELLRSQDLRLAVAAKARQGVAVRLLAEGTSPELDGFLRHLPTVDARRAPEGVLPTCILADRSETVVIITAARPGGPRGETLVALRTSVAHFVGTYEFLIDGMWKAVPAFETSARPPKAPRPARKPAST